MADIKKLTRLLNGVVRNVDMEDNTLVTTSVKVGGITNTELTKAILDKLILMKDLTDVTGRYGAGDVTVAATPANYSAATADVEAHLAGLDTALVTAGSLVFDDSLFRIQDNVDATKEIAFEATNITTATTRTITMADQDLNLDSVTAGTGTFANATLSNLGTTAINTSLISDTASTDSLGSSGVPWLETHSDKVFAGGNASSWVGAPVLSVIGGFEAETVEFVVRNDSAADFYYDFYADNGAIYHDMTGQISAANAKWSASTSFTGGFAAGFETESNATDGFARMFSKSGAAADNIIKVNDVLIDIAGGTNGAATATATQPISIHTGAKTGGTGDSGAIDITTGTSVGGVRGLITLDTAIDKAVLANQPTGGTALAIATTGYVDTLVSGLEFQDSVLDYVVDNTAVPASEVSGDRYALSHDGGAPHANYDGASAGDIVEFDGTNWIATTPTTGMFVSADDEPTLLYYWGGAAWSQKLFEATTASTGLTKSGVDIRLADSAVANGIVVSSGSISAQLAASGGLKFVSSEFSIEPADFAGTGLEDDGSDNLRLATQGNGIAGGAGSTLSVDPATEVTGSRAFVYVGADGVGIDLDNSTLTHASSVLQVKASGIGETELNNVDGGVDAQSFVLPTGYTAGAGTVAAADTVDAAIRKLDGNIAAINASDASTVQEDLIAGETLPAGLKAVRYARAADAGFVAGRVYLADNDATTVDNFHVTGLAVCAGELITATINDVVKAGKITATAHGFTIGEPIFLGAAGALTSTAPSAANEAAVKVGVARDANTIDVQIQIMGVN